jgi:hemerythrin-like metal-binding protein
MDNSTELIQWKDSFNTGFARVDEQHKGLVKIINDLYHMQEQKGNKDDLKQIFTQLINYTVNHFSMEEILMKEHDYEDYVSHKEEHLNFVSKILELKDKYISGSETVRSDVLNFLKEWLLTHIIGTDRATFNSINRKLF